MDIEKLNEDMTALLRGEIIDVPEFNFLIGVREYHGHYLKIEEKDVVIMEGIHSLNPKMTYALNDEDKYRIYVSPLNQLYVTCGTEDSEPHKVSTIDSRLLRRMVRDNRCRGNSPEKTLEMWASVRKGEEKYIFPYEDQADVMFNSGLLYEYSAIKAEAVRLLEMVGESSPYYQDVCRLKKFMDVFCEMDTECIPPSSILREFIGGSCFE
jgi:uridine kinase